jgi:hypothetical protein
VLKLAYSAVAKFVAFAPIANIPAIARTAREFKSGLYVLSLILQ